MEYVVFIMRCGLNLKGFLPRYSARKLRAVQSRSELEDYLVGPLFRAKYCHLPSTGSVSGNTLPIKLYVDAHLSTERWRQAFKDTTLKQQVRRTFST